MKDFQNGLVIKATNDTEKFIKAYDLKPKIAQLTLLYYQFSYLNSLSKDDKAKENIVCSYFERNYHAPHVVVVSYYQDKREYVLRRIRLEEDVYKKIERMVGEDKEIPIGTNLIDVFNKIA